jgi:NADH-quinone oxidoreductase subunit F
MTGNKQKGGRGKVWKLVLIVVAILFVGGGWWVWKEGRPWYYGLEAYVYGFPMMMMDLTMDYDSIAQAGSMLGSGAVIVMDDSNCMVKVLDRISYFYFEESCGQCTPCREGTGWMHRVVHRIETGRGRPEDLDLLDDVAKKIMGRTICALGDAAAMPVAGFIKHFRDEFQYHIDNKKCMV